jgi:hypothetical protein
LSLIFCSNITFYTLYFTNTTTLFFFEAFLFWRPDATDLVAPLSGLGLTRENEEGQGNAGKRRRVTVVRWYESETHHTTTRGATSLQGRFGFRDVAAAGLGFREKAEKFFWREKDVKISLTL